ncbi:hypothetical protein E8E13_006398 [Curvularia kusanoi]|uniref:G domain-containing protein n=1 Tax=Curvularia kusanoi TaxID=90978 RepID=A0A9P4THZ6_CURKU|nr:hypothetical protein E8E13_006398 [Curvularia kusanoi]
MSRLTGQHSEAAAYEFTTLTTVPGQVMYNGAKIQVLDFPGIIQGSKDRKSHSRQVIAVAKTCHLVFIVLDIDKPLTDKRIIENDLEGFGTRINKSPAKITQSFSVANPPYRTAPVLDRRDSRLSVTGFVTQQTSFLLHMGPVIASASLHLNL